jgi:hypothetical protein
METNQFKGIDGPWTMVSNTSWGESHKEAFGDKQGFVVCYRKNNELKALASVIGVLGEKQEVIKANAKLIAEAPKLLTVLQGLVSDVNSLLSDNAVVWQQAGYYKTARNLIKEILENENK